MSRTDSVVSLRDSGVDLSITIVSEGGGEVSDECLEPSCCRREVFFFEGVMDMSTVAHAS